MNIRKLSQFIVIALILTLFLSACSSGNGSGNGNNQSNQSGDSATKVNQDTNQQEAPEDVTIRLVGWMSPDDPLWGVDIPAAFNEAYPHITLLIESTGGNANDTLETVATLNAAGTPADLTWIHHLPEFVKDDLLLDLQPFIDESYDFFILEEIIESLTWDGKLVALPRAVDAKFVYVNKEMLYKYGLEMPDNDWTWDDYRHYARAATDPAEGDFGISPIHFNYIVATEAYAVSNGLAPNLGFMNEDFTQSVLTTPEALSAIQWFQDISLIDGSIPNDDQMGEAGITGNFLEGKILFDINGQWVGEDRRNNATFEWDVLPLPRGHQGQVGSNSISPIGVLKGSKNTEAALQFLTWLYSPEGQQLLLGASLPMTEDNNSWNVMLETNAWAGTNIQNAVVSDRAWAGHIVGYEQDIPWGHWEIQQFFKVGERDINVMFKQRAEDFNRYTLELREQLGWN